MSMPAKQSLVYLVAIHLSVFFLHVARVEAQLIAEPGAQYELPKADGGDSGHSTCDGLYYCRADTIADQGRIYLYLSGTGGLYKEKSVWGLLYNDFTYTPEGGQSTPATLTGEGAWEGHVLVAQGTGSESSFEVRVQIRDIASDEFVASKTIYSATCQGTLCDHVPDQQVNFRVDFTVSAGRAYRIEYYAQCKINMGIEGAGVGCDFEPDFLDTELIYRHRFVLEIGRDLEWELDELKEELAALKREFYSHSHGYMTGRGQGHNDVEVSTSTPLVQQGDESSAPPQDLGAATITVTEPSSISSNPSLAADSGSQAEAGTQEQIESGGGGAGSIWLLLMLIWALPTLYRHPV